MRFSLLQRQHSLRLEWLLLVALLTACVLWFSSSGFLARSNAWLQDMMGRLPGHPASPDVVLVLADDRSVATVGRWPWRRALHAQVLRHISQGNPQSIGVDILFAEEDWDYPEDDWLLARAIADSAKVVLPVTRPALDSGAAATQPLSMMAQAAARLGHTNVVRDVDGGVRSFYQVEGPAAAPWLHLGLAMLCVERPNQPICQLPPGAHAAQNSALWLQLYPTHIAFADGTAPFTSYSYVDVLQGRIPASAFRNKHVLIGVSATGVATLQPTPGTQQAMSNVELVGHIVSGAVQQLHTQAASDGANRLFNVAPVWLGLLALVWLGPSAALIASLVLGVCTLLAATLALLWWQVAFTPAAALFGLLLAYPLWSWRRLNAAARFLEQEMRQLPGQQLLPIGGTNDFLQRRITAVESASQQLRQLHHFVSETLLQLPAPTLACDGRGHILLFNSAAQQYAQSLQRSLVQGQNVAVLLEGAIQRDTQRPLWCGQPLPSVTHWQCEGVDVCQRSLLLIARAFTVAQDSGWLITLVDISELRDALAQRDQAMHFISHDIRAPIGAILSLIDMERSLGSMENEGRIHSGDLLERIQRYARSSLMLADDFVHLARAQQKKTSEYQPVDIGMVMEQALDDAWALAAERRVRLDWPVPEQAAWVLGDASQLRRACLNLLTNAIKYGPAGGTVHCTLEAEGPHWTVAVRDEGDGIAPEEQQRLFTPFTRQRQHERSSIAGIGLGLTYVQTVVEQHGGNISVCNVAGEMGATAGAQFRLSLPQCPEPVSSSE